MQITETCSSVLPVDGNISAPSEATRGGRIMGLLVIALGPALFWTAFVALLAPVIGYAVSPTALLTVACGIGIFLLAVCSTLISPSH